MPFWVSGQSNYWEEDTRAAALLLSAAPLPRRRIWIFRTLCLVLGPAITEENRREHFPIDWQASKLARHLQSHHISPQGLKTS